MEHLRGMIIEDLPVYNSISNYYIDNPTNSPTEGVLSEHFPITLCRRRPGLRSSNGLNDGYFSTSYRSASICSDSNELPPDMPDARATQSQLPKFKSAPSLRIEREQRFEKAPVGQNKSGRNGSTMEVPNSPLAGLSKELRQVSGLPFMPDAEIPLALTLPVGLRRASKEDPPLPVGLTDDIEIPTTPGEEYEDHNEFPFPSDENWVTQSLATPTTSREEFSELKEFPFAFPVNTKCSSPNCKVAEQAESETDLTSPRSSVGSSTMASSIFGSVQSRKGSIETRSSRATTLGSIDGTLTKFTTNPRASDQATRPRLASLPSESSLERPNPATTATAPEVQVDAQPYQVNFSEPPHLCPSPRQESQSKLQPQPNQRPSPLRRFSFRLARCVERREDRKSAKNQAKQRRACNRELNKLAFDTHRKKQRQLKGQEDRMVKDCKKELKDMEKERRENGRDLGDVVDGFFGLKLVR